MGLYDGERTNYIVAIHLAGGGYLHLPQRCRQRGR